MSIDDHTSVSARYAVYFVPDSDSALWQVGTDLIGYDSIDGRFLSAPPQALARLIPPELWTEPRRYGFHATLRAPFELTEGYSRDDLLAAVARCARRLMPVEAGPIRPELMGGFVALTFETMAPELISLAVACVVHVEHLRAPLSPADRARRLAASLTPRQVELLDRWGYPYVHEQFKFHMTLTGKLSESARRPVLDAIGKLYAPVASPLRIGSISVLEQSRRSASFRVIERFALGG